MLIGISGKNAALNFFHGHLQLMVQGAAANGIVAAQLFTVQHFFDREVLPLLKPEGFFQLRGYIKFYRNAILRFFYNTLDF